ncbi:MAG TPA: hypothetical protein VG994_13720 [Steroidobacteraceae bacterium]|nr:hypothetical protein [Steroidobacteraceae bacterium]
MRFSVMLAVVVLAGCAGTAPQEPPVEHQEKLTAKNIVEAQQAGYKLVDENGSKRYCRRELNTGSHVRYTTTCLTEEEMLAVLQASRQSVEAMRRTKPPPQERSRGF